MRLLIRDGTLVTFGSPCRVLEGQAVLIEGDRIVRIASPDEIPGPFDRVLSARGKVVLPGFVNAHMHYYSTLVRGLGKAAPSADFQQVLENLWWRLDRKLSLDDVEVSAKVILLDAIRKGTTTLVDHHASPGAVRGSLGRIAKAVRESGLRSCLCYEVSDRDGEAVAQEGLEENADFARDWAGGRDPQLRALFGLHAAFTLSDETLATASKMGRDLGVGFHVHVAEAASDVAVNRAKYGKTPAQRLVAHGILREGSIAAHAVHCDDADKDALAASGAWVVTNPQSNLNNAVGIADVLGLVKRGIPVGLGTDAMTVGMLEELRVGLWAQHLRQESPSCGFMELAGTLFVENPKIASRLWGFQIGTLAEGAAADVVLVDYLPPTAVNDSTVLGDLVFGVSQAVVDTTISGGRVLMEGRKLAIDVDEEALAAESRRLANALWERF